MILTIEPDQRAKHSDIINKMHEMRGRVITRWRWDVPGLKPDYDKDDFDTDDTVYFIDFDPILDRVVGTCRFNPTVKPHILSDVFPEMCTLLGVPQNDHTWEATRYIVDGHGIPKWQELRSRVIIALALSEYAHANGITHMSWLTTQALYNNMFKLWPSKPLGLPKYFEADDNTYIAAISELKAESTAVLRERAAAFPSVEQTDSLEKSA